LVDDIHDIWLDIPEERAEISPVPGQFAHIRAGENFLRRPISIAGFDRVKKRVRIIVRASGKGTAAIAGMSPGSSTKALLPLGRPYPLEICKRNAKIWLVGGGIGAAPLIFAAKYIASEMNGGKYEIKSFLGFRDSESIFGGNELGEFGDVALAAGGFVTDLVTRDMTSGRPDVILSCGPAPMLSSLRKICMESGIQAYVSLEARMGCGVGACLVCNCRLSLNGKTEYRRVCKDGPVFEISEVAFE
jgi:dihydroorotate dehydrogenase electron transfer subunit